MATDKLTQQILEARSVANVHGIQAGIEFLMYEYGWDREDAELEFFSKSKRKLYEGFKPKEGDSIQYVGVPVMDWRPEWGEPTMAFVEYREEGDS